MRPIPALILALALLPSHSFAEKKRESCLYQGRQAKALALNTMQAALDKVKSQEADIQIQNRVQNCREKLMNFMSACHNPTLENSVNCVEGDQVPKDENEVKQQAKGDESAKGLNNAGEAMVKGLLGKANCARSLASCFRRGGKLRGFPTRDEVESACSDDLSGAKSDGDRKWIQSMKEARDAIYAQKEKTAKCLDDEGKATEQLAQQVYEQNVMSTRGDQMDKKFAIGCLDRQESFRYCAYTQNGEAPKIQNLDRAGDYDPEQVTRRGAPAYISESGCSGQCVGNSGMCHTVVTAGHCVDGLQNGATMTVYDQYNQAQSVHASDCNSPYQGQPGSMDYAFCKLDRPVYNTRGVDVAMFDSSVTGSSCSRDSSFSYIQRCGPAFYQQLASSRQEISATTFPAGGRISYVSGHILYDSNTNRIYHDLLTAPGASGAGILINNPLGGGSPLLVGAHAFSPNIELRGGASVPQYNWKTMSVERVSNQKLSQGTAFMAQFADGT